MSTTPLKIERPSIHVDFGWKAHVPTISEVESKLEDPNWLGLIAFVPRIGIQAFFRQLELEFFPPVGPQNDLYQLLHIKWPKSEPYPYIVGLIPMRFKELASWLASEHSLRLANGVPHQITINGQSSSTEVFPYNGDNCFTLENTEGHPSFFPSPEYSRAIELELCMCNTILVDYQKRYKVALDEMARRKGGKK